MDPQTTIHVYRCRHHQCTLLECVGDNTPNYNRKSVHQKQHPIDAYVRIPQCDNRVFWHEKYISFLCPYHEK